MQNFENYDVIRVFDEKALDKNIKNTRKMVKTPLGVVVKANSYGIGLERTLPIFEKNKISDFFTQDIIEALKIKRLLENKNANIYVFAGVQSGQAETFIKNGIIPLCVSLEQIKYFNKVANGLRIKPKIGIHFDTGMNRTGLSMAEVNELSQNFDEITKNLDTVLYLSHLHSSYTKTDVANKVQLNRFKEIISKLPKRKCSLSATGGSFRLSNDYHFDLLRVGYGIYGILKEMESVVSVYAKILQIRDVVKGEKIGYFGGYKATKNIKVAIINIGYKDGYSRSLSHTNKWKDLLRSKLKSGANFATSYMVIDGKYRCPVVGIISMNNTIIDVSNVPEKVLKKAKWVEVIGKNANLMQFREANGFIPCDLLTSLLCQNPNAIDMSMAEFKNLKI